MKQIFYEHVLEQTGLLLAALKKYYWLNEV